MKIGLFFDPKWAPGCLLIVQVAEDGQPTRNPREFPGVSILVQRDYDFLGVANMFGWDPDDVMDIPAAQEWLFDHASYLPAGQQAELVIDDPGYFTTQ